MEKNLEKQEQGLELVNEQPRGIALASTEYQTVDVDIAKLDQAADLIESAVTIPMKANVEAWKPKEGDSLKGIYKGIETVMMPPVGDKTGEKRPVQIVVFMTPKVIFDPVSKSDIKTLEPTSILGARAVNHFTNVPKMTLWNIVFQGQKVVGGKPNNMYDFYQMSTSR